MSALNIIAYPDQAALAASVSAQVCEKLKHAIKTRGAGRLIATGGTAAPTVYADLSRRSLDWRKVTIVLSDERWVPAEHEASNARLVRQSLLQHEAAAASFHPFDQSQSSAGLAAERFNAAYTNGLWADCAVLGIGADLHVASIFPAGGGMANAMEATCAAVLTTPSPLPESAPFSRISLTLHAMAQTGEAHFVMFGNAKRTALQTAVNNGDTPPAVALLHGLEQRAWVHWCPDSKGDRP